MTETKSIAAKTPTSPDLGDSSSGSQPKVPQRLQRQRVTEAMRMVERESVNLPSPFCHHKLTDFLGLPSSTLLLLVLGASTTTFRALNSMTTELIANRTVRDTPQACMFTIFNYNQTHIPFTKLALETRDLYIVN
jgi:hypothetical protein